MSHETHRLSVSPDLPEDEKRLLRIPKHTEVNVRFGAPSIGAGALGIILMLAAIIIGGDPTTTALLIAAGYSTLTAVVGLGYLRSLQHPASKRDHLARHRADHIVDPGSLDSESTYLLKRAQKATDNVLAVPSEALRDRTDAIVVMYSAEWQVAAALRDDWPTEQVKQIVGRMEKRAEQAITAQGQRRGEMDPGSAHALEELDRLDKQDWAGLGDSDRPEIQ